MDVPVSTGWMNEEMIEWPNASSRPPRARTGVTDVLGRVPKDAGILSVQVAPTQKQKPMTSERNLQLPFSFSTADLFVKQNSLTKGLLHSLSPFPGAFNQFLPLKDFNFGQRWGGEQNLSCETVSVKSGFRPSHRNLKQSACSAATDRFKPSGMKAAPRLSIWGRS